MKSCQTCLYSRTYSYGIVCIGQKNSPSVKSDFVCENWKPYISPPCSKLSDTTLQRMTKKELIDYIRLLEKNYVSVCKQNEQQAINCKDLLTKAEGTIAELKSMLQEEI